MRDQFTGKEPKTIAPEDEARLSLDTAIAVGQLADKYPNAREIDLLNSVLNEFRIRNDIFNA